MFFDFESRKMSDLPLSMKFPPTIVLRFFQIHSNGFCAIRVSQVVSQFVGIKKYESGEDNVNSFSSNIA